MKLAVTGKGGVGKTTVAGILARSLARDGQQVLAIDADPNPNLALSLGVDPDAARQLESAINALLRERAEHAHEHGHEPTHSCEPPARDADEIVADLGTQAPDGVQLVQTGTIERPADGCLCCGSHGTTRRLFTELGAEDRIVLADLEAGVNDLIWARPEPGDTVLVVTRPYAKSLAVAGHAVAVARELGVERIMLVANGLADDDDLDLVTSAVPGVPVVALPEDDAVLHADRDGRATWDAAPDSPVVRVLTALGQQLVAQPEPAG